MKEWRVGFHAFTPPPPCSKNCENVVPYTKQKISNPIDWMPCDRAAVSSLGCACVASFGNPAIAGTATAVCNFYRSFLPRCANLINSNGAD